MREGLTTTKALGKELNCTCNIINQYLCRGDFSHIKRFRVRNQYFFEGITEEDKKLLKCYIDDAKERSGHKTKLCKQKK